VAGAVALVGQAFVVTGLVLAVIRGDPSGQAWGWALRAVGIFVARALLGWVADIAAARAAGDVGAGLRRRVIAALVSGRSTHGASVGGSTGKLAVLATHGVSAAEPYLTRYVPALVLACVLPVITLVVIAILDPISGVIVLCTLPLIPLFGILVGLATRDRAQRQWQALEALAGHFLDVMRGLPTLVAFRRAEAQSDTIAEVTDGYRIRNLATLRIAFASAAILELVATISVALVAVTIGIRLAAGHVGLHTALVVLLLAPEAYWPLRRVGSEFHAAAEGIATFEAAAELAPDLPHAALAGTRERPGTGLTLDAVSVTYPGRARAALAPVTLQASVPGITAITGPSGCGKSTLLDVLAGRLEPTTGIALLPQADQVALLPQRPVFVAGTIADNLRLALPEATDDELWSELGAVALADRIRALPHGLDTDLAEDGASLSAGERARLALARVGLSGRCYVLLDEPTAHLDRRTELIIAETVGRWGRDRCVVLVAHRPALVALADRVVELTPVPTVADLSQIPAGIRAGSLASRPEFAPARLPQRVNLRRVGGWGAAVVGGLASICGIALTATAGWLIVRADARPAILTLTVAMVAVRTFGLARPGLRYLERLWSHDRALRLLARRRVAVYDALVPLVPGRLGRRRGDVLASVVDDVDAVLDTELRVRLPIRSYVVTALLVIVAAALIRPVGGVVVALDALVAGLVFALARLGAARAEAAAVDGRAALSEAVVDVAQTAAELRMWGAGDRATDTVVAAGRQAAEATITSATWLGAARALSTVTAGLGVAAIALLLRSQVASGDLSGPVLTLLLLLPLALAEAVTTVADAGAASARGTAAARRLQMLTDQLPAITESRSPVPPSGDSTVATAALAAHERTLPDIALTPGDRLAIVGTSGSGKSTLAALLLRFLDPDAGRVELGGIDYRDLAAADVRARVGLVDDDPHVFASTVAENVRFARPGCSDADVDQALRQAHLGDWLDALPDGLGTHLGDGQAAVSGGERARLAIARSLLADQPVLVLDEPTAHLDSPTAASIAEEVLGSGRAGGDRSVIWITHAETGLDRVDRVIGLAPPDPGASAATARQEMSPST